MTENFATTDAAAPRTSALIIAGAAGKGPYAAGVLSELAGDTRFYVSHVSGASSGALNAAVYAAGLRVGRAKEAALELCDLWRDKADWYRIFSHAQRVKIVADALSRYAGMECKREVSLELVVATLRGCHDEYGALRFERSYKFTTIDFAKPEGIAQIAERCIQSSTIPVLFPPRSYGNEGQFWDGGLVNNTPIGDALKWDPTIDHLLVITPDSAQLAPSSTRHGRFAINRLLEMVIEERLARDLNEAKSFNEELVKLYRAGVDPRTLDREVKWRLLQFVELRPARDLPGSLISGFISASRRRLYIQEGQAAARQVLAAWQPQGFEATPQ